MRPLPEKCEGLNDIASFCGCMNEETEPDPAAAGFCARAAGGTGQVTGDELVELKKALKDLEEQDPDECCCEC